MSPTDPPRRIVIHHLHIFSWLFLFFFFTQKLFSTSNWHFKLKDTTLLSFMMHTHIKLSIEFCAQFYKKLDYYLTYLSTFCEKFIFCSKLDFHPLTSLQALQHCYSHMTPLLSCQKKPFLTFSLDSVVFWKAQFSLHCSQATGAPYFFSELKHLREHYFLDF